MQRLVLVFLCSLLLASSLAAAERILDFRGSESRESRDFEVRAPFIIDYWVNSDHPRMMGIEISLIDAKTGTHEGYILQSKNVTNGVRLLDTSGTYRIKVDGTMARYVIKVDELTREEAAAYTPKELF